MLHGLAFVKQRQDNILALAFVLSEFSEYSDAVGRTESLPRARLPLELPLVGRGSMLFLSLLFRKDMVVCVWIVQREIQSDICAHDAKRVRV